MAYVQQYEVFLRENLMNGHILPQTRGYNFTVFKKFISNNVRELDAQ